MSEGYMALCVSILKEVRDKRGTRKGAGNAPCREGGQE